MDQCEHFFLASLIMELWKIILGVVGLLAVIAIVVTTIYEFSKSSESAKATVMATAAPFTAAPVTAAPVTAAPVTATPVPAYTTLNYLDSSGSDMDGSPIANIATASACEAQCAGSPGCVGIAYAPTTSQCWLKSKLSNSNISYTAAGPGQRTLGFPTASGIFLSSLVSPGVLRPGSALVSSSATFAMLVQTDNNVVIYNLTTGLPTWATSTNKASGPVTFTQQGDGNAVVYDVNNKPVWASMGGTPGGAGTYTLTMNDDGTLKTYDVNSHAIWST